MGCGGDASTTGSLGRVAQTIPATAARTAISGSSHRSAADGPCVGRVETPVLVFVPAVVVEVVVSPGGFGVCVTSVIVSFQITHHSSTAGSVKRHSLLCCTCCSDAVLL